jgi:hypothetical protein
MIFHTANNLRKKKEKEKEKEKKKEKERKRIKEGIKEIQ